MKVEGTTLYARDERVIDLDTGRAVPHVLWLDLGGNPDKASGLPDLLEAYQEAPDGRVARDREGSLLTFTAAGRFRVVPLSQTPRPAAPPRRKVVMGAPRCARCPSPLTLPGDDLCPTCRAAQTGQRNKFRVERVLDPLKLVKCDAKGCGRAAAYSVTDEVDVTPAVGPAQGLFGGRERHSVLYSRGACVGRRFYCAHHFRPPRLLDARGEVMAEDHEAQGTRPQ